MPGVTEMQLTLGLTQHTVAILLISPGKIEQTTGVCISYNGGYFVATAAHVLVPWPDTLSLIPKPKGDYVYDRPATARSRGFVPSIAEVLRSEHPKDDVALLRFQERPKEIPESNFYPADLKPPRPLRQGRQVVIFGHPAVLTKKHHIVGITNPEVQPMGDAPYITQVPRHSKLRQAGFYNAALHFVMDFPLMPKSNVNEPGGLSGAGVWAPYIVDSAVWQPGVDLLGIQVRWHRSTRLLIATRIKRVWRVLDTWRKKGSRDQR